MTQSNRTAGAKSSPADGERRGLDRGDIVDPLLKVRVSLKGVAGDVGKAARHPTCLSVAPLLILDLKKVKTKA